MNKIFALIPARAGSKGVPNKNIMELNGHPLLGWSIAAAKKSKLIDRVVVSTDSHEYADIAMLYGAEVPFIRPNEISNDSSTDLEFIEHALDFFRSESNEPDYIAHLRPTTPIRDPDLIDEAIKLLQDNQEFTSLRSVHKMSESSYKTLEINNGILTTLTAFKGGEIDANKPRQSFPDTYQANGYVDILSTSFILKNNEIHGKKILPFITKPAYELDSIEELDYLEYLAANSQCIISKLFN